MKCFLFLILLELLVFENSTIGLLISFVVFLLLLNNPGLAFFVIQVMQELLSGVKLRRVEPPPQTRLGLSSHDVLMIHIKSRKTIQSISSMNPIKTRFTRKSISSIQS